MRAAARDVRREHERQRTLYEQHLSEAQSALRAQQATHDREKKEFNAKLASYITKASDAEKRVRYFFFWRFCT